MAAKEPADLYYGKFMEVSIPFSQDNHASVFFAHLQNVLSEISNQLNLNDNMQFNKVDRVLYDIYLEHQKLQANFATIQKGMKEIMEQFSKTLQDCKNDREQLAKALEDRQSLLNKLKQANQQSYQTLSQNQVLRATVTQLNELNGLLTEKNQVLEQQAKNFKMSVLGMEDYARISKQYDRLLQSNTDMRKDMLEIVKQTQSLQNISTPFKIICAAFAENPEAINQIWKNAAENKSFTEKIAENQQSLKQKFYEFDYESFIKEKS